MRVSGGELRSREIHVPGGRAVRPTPGRVREALFSIVGERVRDARVLDLFAGTGAIGFEALSRGAAHATFVEAHASTAARIRDTAKRLGVADRATVVAATAERAARTLAGPFDFVYADPPFAAGPPATTLEELHVRGVIVPGTLVVYERRSRHDGSSFAGMTLRRTARYGDVALEFFEVHA
jgi:16S rRNA (guanine(966)-N(2))-methyltransferase RsmD